MSSAPIRGRGAAENPANRFEPIHYVSDAEAEETHPDTLLYKDTSRTILARNQSPDVGFEFSVNPYRGCEHGCVYCYARPYHEYLGFSAGLDFETRILVKEDAPLLLRKELLSPKWEPQTIAISGVTDAYQPAERRLGLTRACLEVLVEFSNPAAIVTKNYLVTRDADLLSELAVKDAASVNLSITTLDAKLQRTMEPRASTPSARLAAVRELSEQGIPVRVMVGPVIPGLTEHEIPSILEAATGAGAVAASYILLRLPHGVKDLFESWLERCYPDRKKRVLNRIRETRGGNLYSAEFHERMKGTGVYARQIGELFQVTCRRLGLNRKSMALSADAFRRPGENRQLNLFPG